MEMGVMEDREEGRAVQEGRRGCCGGRMAKGLMVWRLALMRLAEESVLKGSTGCGGHCEQDGAVSTIDNQ
jgi:hypothetical protein